MCSVLHNAVSLNDEAGVFDSLLGMLFLGRARGLILTTPRFKVGPKYRPVRSLELSQLIPHGRHSLEVRLSIWNPWADALIHILALCFVHEICRFSEK